MPPRLKTIFIISESSVQNFMLLSQNAECAYLLHLQGGGGVPDGGAMDVSELELDGGGGADFSMSTCKYRLPARPIATPYSRSLTRSAMIYGPAHGAPSFLFAFGTSSTITESPTLNERGLSALSYWRFWRRAARPTWVLTKSCATQWIWHVRSTKATGHVRSCVT